MTKLFLDDIRDPEHCMGYMSGRMKNNDLSIYRQDGWVVVRSHEEFVAHIIKHGIPDIVSFDHDLALEHYSEKMYSNEEEYVKSIEGSEPTGYDSAKLLVDVCKESGHPLPKWESHSMNPVGAKRISDLLSNA